MSIQERDIFEIVREIPLEDVIQRYSPNHPIIRNGKVWILCPFHAEKTPSLSLRRHRWKCFGCQAGGDGVDFVTQLYNLSPIEAAGMIAKDFDLVGVDADKPLTTQQRAEIRKRQRKRKLEAAWKDGVNVLFRMAYAMRDAILAVVAPGNVGCDVLELLATLACLIDVLETGNRDNILNLLNGGDPNRWN